MRVVFYDSENMLVTVDVQSIGWNEENDTVQISDGNPRGLWVLVGVSENVYDDAMSELLTRGCTAMFQDMGIIGEWKCNDTANNGEGSISSTGAEELKVFN